MFLTRQAYAENNLDKMSEKGGLTQKIEGGNNNIKEILIITGRVIGYSWLRDTHIMVPFRDITTRKRRRVELLDSELFKLSSTLYYKAGGGWKKKGVNGQMVTGWQITGR